MAALQDINPQAQLLASLNPSTKDKSKEATADIQDRFLSLLVAQLKNQDPLNPLDNAQVTSQLAQISTVNGLNKLDATLQGIASNFNTTQELQAASMIGHGVFAEGSKTLLANKQALGGIELTRAADQVVVSIKDSSGIVLQKIDLGKQDAGIMAWQWDGVTDSGQAAAEGVYSFSVEAKFNNQVITATPLAYGLVNSISKTEQGLVLNVGNVGSIGLSDVKQIL